jgi:ArsR family transcriptional regulator
LINVTGVATVTAKNLEQALRLFRALGDETRLRLIDRLREGEQCVCDLTDELEAGQSRLSFHLKTLKEAGVVTDRREGRWVYYALNPEVFEALEAIVGELKPLRRGLRVLRPGCD